MDWLEDESELEGATGDEEDDSGGTLEVLDELSDDIELLDDEELPDDEEFADDELSLDADVCEDELLAETLDDGLRLELPGPIPEPDEGVKLDPEVSELSEVLEPEGKPLKLESEDELTGTIEDVLE